MAINTKYQTGEQKQIFARNRLGGSIYVMYIYTISMQYIDQSHE